MSDAARKGMGPEETARCVEAVLAGETDRFRELVEAHQPLVYAVALAVLRSSQDAAEAAQEAWTEAFAHLKGLRRADRFAPWVAQIARMRAYTMLAQRKRRGAPLEAAGDPEAPAAAEPGAGAGDESAARIREWVYALPLRYREAFLLHHLEGKSYKEIAEALGLRERSVETRLYRARQALLRKWKRWNKDRKAAGR